MPLLPIMRAGLDGGDDLHGRVSAANAALVASLAPRLSGEAREYLTLANQFVLNVIMAACAVMIGAGEGIEDSRLVTAAGGNGVDFGWQLAGASGDLADRRRRAAGRSALSAHRRPPLSAGDRRQRGDRCLRLWRGGAALCAGDDHRFARSRAR